MKRARLNLVLLAVAAGLGVAVYFAQRKVPAGPPLTPYKADAIVNIALEHPDAPAIRLEKHDRRWRLTAPVQAEADEFEVNALVALADRETQMKLEGGVLKELGLDPPGYTLTLNDRVIGFGAIESLEYRRYVKLADGAYLIDDPPGAALDADYADLVAKDLLPGEADIERIEVPGLTLAKDAAGRWAVTPADPDASADAMQKLADAWTAARAMWNEPARGARTTGERARVTLAGGATREFVIAAREPQLKLHRADLGVTFVLSKALADELLKLPEPPAPEELEAKEAATDEK
jgi:hypothetical protein